MEILKQKYTIAKKALGTLAEVLEEIQKPIDEKHRKITRDSIVQRFEYSIELFWKYLKAYLQEKELIGLESVSPNAVITEAQNANIISHDDAEILKKAIKDRNLTSHMYRENLAEDLLEIAPEYYEVMQKLLDSLRP